MHPLTSRLLLALTLLTVSASSQAGISGSDPFELHIHVTGLHSLHLVGRVRAVGWRGRTATLEPRRLQTPVALAGFAAKAPAGEWSEMVLVLDGPITFTAETAAGAPVLLTLQMDQLVVPLADPTGGQTVALDLALPDWIAAASTNGLDVRPGDPLYDRLVAAFQDGALGVVAP